MKLYIYRSAFLYPDLHSDRVFDFVTGGTWIAYDNEHPYGKRVASGRTRSACIRKAKRELKRRKKMERQIVRITVDV